MRLPVSLIVGLTTFTALAQPLHADPCGLVPPRSFVDGPAIKRIGVQTTYVFFQNGVESIVLRPGFSGSLDEFGMLIPFPSPPAIRKVPDTVFATRTRNWRCNCWRSMRNWDCRDHRSNNGSAILCVAII